MENRAYGRTKLNVKALLYDSRQNKEISCEVDNISERGICFRIPLEEPYRNNLQFGETLSFQFIDTFMERPDTPTDFIVAHRGQIRHITETSTCMIVGCYIVEAEFEQYAIRRKLANYLNSKREREKNV